VWDLDLVRLTQISKFYNSTNHAQPTWDNQIVSRRNIWITHGKPIDKAVAAEAWRKGLFKIFKHIRQGQFLVTSWRLSSIQGYSSSLPTFLYMNNSIIHFRAVQVVVRVPCIHVQFI
jgi:hypothetical protein